MFVVVSIGCPEWSFARAPCVGGFGRTLDLSGCGLTDDDLGDIAVCFDTVGRENLVDIV